MIDWQQLLWVAKRQGVAVYRTERDRLPVRISEPPSVPVLVSAARLTSAGLFTPPARGGRQTMTETLDDDYADDRPHLFGAEPCGIGVDTFPAQCKDCDVYAGRAHHGNCCVAVCSRCQEQDLGCLCDWPWWAKLRLRADLWLRGVVRAW